MDLFVVSQAWRTAYPGAAAGVLAMGSVINPAHHFVLEEAKVELEQQLRSRFASREEVRDQERLQAYKAYYRRFKKTYHVQMQLESVALMGKSIPRVAALVEAMFMAELKNQLLTAGHDLDAIQVPAKLDIAQGTERYTCLNGQEQQLKAGDMFIADARGILSAVIYGPARYASILPTTRHVLFTVYAPPGIGTGAVAEHLRDIEAFVRLIEPEAETELLQVYGAG